MRLSGQFQGSFFFYEKILSVQKRKSSQNQPTKTKRSKKKTTKAIIFGPQKISKQGKLFVLHFNAFCTLKIFS